MLGQGYALKTLGSVKDASHKRSPIVRFYVYELSRIGKSMESESRLGLLEAGRSGGRK